MLIEPSDVEKKSLEAHVELCAERYRFLEHQLTDVKSAVATVKETIVKTHEMVSKLSEKNNDRIIHWGYRYHCFFSNHGWISFSKLRD